MLLSRVADSLYWISRYLERAEHTARLVDVAVDQGLGRASSFTGSAVERLYQSVGLASNRRTCRLSPAAHCSIAHRLRRSVRDRGARERTSGARGD